MFMLTIAFGLLKSQGIRDQSFLAERVGIASLAA